MNDGFSIAVFVGLLTVFIGGLLERHMAGRERNEKPKPRA